MVSAYTFSSHRKLQHYRHERLGTTALYLNLTDLHVVEEYARKW